MNAPGSWRAVVDDWRPFTERALPQSALFVADERVLRLHPSVARALRGRRVLSLKAGEGAKSLRTLERLALASLDVPRGATVVAIGGGTIGDVATVFAHLHKRGAELIHVPTTLLAAVDSSVGGKGAINIGTIKNALGVFHAPIGSWICPTFFDTLTEAQRREGRLEAYKMALGDATKWKRWTAAAPDDVELVRQARALKTALCTRDPYETTGLRTVLNFGHTFGHVIESVTGHRVRHGEAVGLGMLCALDVGVALGVTPRSIAGEVEAALPNGPHARRRLARALHLHPASVVAELLRADKKGATSRGDVRMVLLERPGRWAIQPVPAKVWRRLLTRWSHE